MNFFFWFFLFFFLIAALQDLKRREVDNWLNLFLVFSGFLYILWNSFLYNEISFFINYAFLVFFMFGLAYLFYFAKIFAGGDAKLLFATTPLLVSVGFLESFLNSLVFCLILLFVGAIYGLFWIFSLFFRDFKLDKDYFFVLIKKNKLFLLLSLVVFLIGIVEPIFISVSFFFLFLLLVFVVSKFVERNSLIREIVVGNLREGDWLEKDIKLKTKTIKSSFEGLSLEDISLLKKYKKTVNIKEGIPYAPVFLFSWVVFFFRGIVMEFLVSVLGL